MPEMTFSVCWPDGAVDRLYSPSLVVHDHLRVGGRYPVAEFVRRSVAAMDEAGERVRVAYGFACTASVVTSDRVRARADGFDVNDTVEVVAMHPPLPVP